MRYHRKAKRLNELDILDTMYDPPVLCFNTLTIILSFGCVTEEQVKLSSSNHVSLQLILVIRRSD
jgi:hypothetical protein